MPAIVSGKGSNLQIFYSSYITTYIERDVKEISDVIDYLKFFRFITAAAEIRKIYLNSGKEPFMYYYRDKDLKEIDIIMEYDGVLNPIEIKKTANPSSELTQAFRLLDKAPVPRSKGAVICMKPELSAVDRNNYVVPVWMI